MSCLPSTVFQASLSSAKVLFTVSIPLLSLMDLRNSFRFLVKRALAEVLILFAFSPIPVVLFGTFLNFSYACCGECVKSICFFVYHGMYYLGIDNVVTSLKFISALLL